MPGFFESLGTQVALTVVVTPITLIVWKSGEAILHRVYNWKLRRAAARYSAAHAGTREVALALSVGDDITESVRGHLAGWGLLGSGAEIPLLTVHQREGFGTSDGQWFAYLNRVKNEIRKIRELGFVRVYVYTRLPVALALMVGATLTNGPEAVILHFNAGKYDEIGRVTFENTKL